MKSIVSQKITCSVIFIYGFYHNHILTILNNDISETILLYKVLLYVKCLPRFFRLKIPNQFSILFEFAPLIIDGSIFTITNSKTLFTELCKTTYDACLTYSSQSSTVGHLILTIY